MFFLPLFDDNPTGRWPLVTWALMAACIAVFFIQVSMTELQQIALWFEYGAVPAVIMGSASLPPSLEGLPPALTLISYVFLHGGWLHIAGNMLFLWIFGDNVEDRMGTIRFIIFYLICGAAASLSHVLISPNSTAPLIGASGAIAGVMAAYLLMFPRAKVRVIMVILIFIRWVHLPAFVVLISWLLLQIFAAPSSLSAEGGTAYFAHLGGFIAGLVLTPIFRKAGTPIWPKAETPPSWQIEPVPARQVKTEFIERYRRKKRVMVPDVKRNTPSQDESNNPNSPWR